MMKIAIERLENVSATFSHVLFSSCVWARAPYFPPVRRCFIYLLIVILIVFAFSANAATGRVNKVLPLFLDLKGRHTLSPSLYDRDAYQAQLRANPDQRSGLRFDIYWRARAVPGTKVKLRAELRGTAKGEIPSQHKLETEIKASATSRWTSLSLEGEDYRKFGEVTAWRVTLWDGEQLIGEQKSFLW